MKVRFRPAARTDLRLIGDYIALDSPKRAVTFVDELEARCERIAEAPESGSPRDDLSAGLRMAGFGRYLIFYRIDAEAIEVIRVLHGARDLASLL